MKSKIKRKSHLKKGGLNTNRGAKIRDNSYNAKPRCPFGFDKVSNPNNDAENQYKYPTDCTNTQKGLKTKEMIVKAKIISIKTAKILSYLRSRELKSSNQVKNLLKALQFTLFKCKNLMFRPINEYVDDGKNQEDSYQYDKYFKIIRSDETMEERMYKAIDIFSMGLQDISDALYSEHDLITFTHGMFLFFSGIEKGETVNIDLDSYIEELGKMPQQVPSKPTSVIDRWKTWHWIFNFYSDLAAENIFKATDALNNGKEEELNNAIFYATAYLQGTTTSLLLGTNFNSLMYLEQVRPDMPKAFSGDANIDFEMFKDEEELFCKAVKLKWDLLSNTSKQLIQTFAETFLIDGEVHTVLAFQAVGSQPSLSGQVAKDEFGCSISASDSLRNITDTRKQRWSFLNENWK